MKKDEVYQEIKLAILQQDLLPGQWLVEREITNKYGLSRTPVREVLRLLESDGLIKIESGKGYLVRKLSLEEVAEIFQAREAVEGMATRIACFKGTDAFYQKVKLIKKGLEKIAKSKNSSPGVPLGRNLHDAIMTAANNPLLSEFYRKLRHLGILAANLTREYVHIEMSALNDHIQIAGALLKKDEVKSEEAMKLHLRSVCQMRIRSYLESQAALPAMAFSYVG